MSIQPILIIGLILTSLLEAVTALIYYRKGLRGGKWYATIGAFIAVLLGYALLGLFEVFSQSTTASMASLVAVFGLITALRWRPRTG